MEIAKHSERIASLYPTTYQEMESTMPALFSRYALVLEEDEMIIDIPAQPEPQTEAEKARAWFSGLNLSGMQENDTFHTEFYKYAVSVYRGKMGYYLHTLSPQQKACGRRAMGTCWARGDMSSLAAGMERFIADREAKASRRNAQKEAKRQARAEFVNPYKVGDFLYSSWGYDQTNREFYQILEVREMSIKVREVYQNRERSGYDSGTCSPVRDSFKEDPRWITIQVGTNGYHSVPSPIHGNLYAYEGKPVYFSDGH